MIRSTLLSILVFGVTAASAVAQTGDFGMVPRVPAAPSPQTVEAAVDGAISRWEIRNNAAVTASVRTPLIRETSRQLRRAPSATDPTPAVETAVNLYLDDAADYRKALKIALREGPVSLPAFPNLPDVPTSSTPLGGEAMVAGSSRSLDLLGAVKGLTGGWFNPVPEVWQLKLIADQVSLKVLIDGGEEDRNPLDVYRVSGGRIRVELNTAHGRCRRDVRPSQATADCGF